MYITKTTDDDYIFTTRTFLDTEGYHVKENTGEEVTIDTQFYTVIEELSYRVTRKDLEYYLNSSYKYFRNQNIVIPDKSTHIIVRYENGHIDIGYFDLERGVVYINGAECTFLSLFVPNGSGIPENQMQVNKTTDLRPLNAEAIFNTKKKFQEKKLQYQN